MLPPYISSELDVYSQLQVEQSEYQVLMFSKCDTKHNDRSYTILSKMLNNHESALMYNFHPLN